jgi:cytochrome c-type biogenesis protein CcmH
VLLWIVIACLTAAAIMAVLVPLGRAAPSVDPLEQGRRVYLDQLRELERDRAQGRIGVPEAEAARVEIARRLLAAEASPGEPPGTEGSQLARRAIALVALIGIPLLSLGTYYTLGAPGMPGQPLAARMATSSEGDGIQALVAKVEAHLAEAPQDGKGWEVIAPVYQRLGRPAEAATAYRNAIRILGSNASRQVGLGEALLRSAGGVVTAEAKAAFSAANEADPSAPAPRYFLALAAEQEGDKIKAAEEWRALLADAPADAPYRASVEAALTRVDPGQGTSGPAPEQIAAAQSMTPADQAAMVEGMVSGLAERLTTQPDDAEGWLRLIRSYVVLGRPAEARQAGEAAVQGVRDAVQRGRIEGADGRTRPGRWSRSAVTRKSRRLAMIGTAGAVLALAAALVLVALRDQIVFFYSPSEIAGKALDAGTRLRLGGLVVDGSVQRAADGSVSFGVTDTEQTVQVSYRGLLPDLFREGQGIVAEGVLTAAGRLEADNVLAKHDENYMPREVADALKARGVWQEGMER